MRQLRETSQHWRDRKRLQASELAAIRAAHRQAVAHLQKEVVPADECKLSGAWKHYSFIEFARDWLLIYRLDKDAVVLVRVARREEIFETL